MSVWIICDADPDCDNHAEPNPELIRTGRLPTGWTGTLTNAHCPDHAHLHVPF